jgi:hypothetical protein
MSVGFARGGPFPGRFVRGIDARSLIPSVDDPEPSSWEWDLEPLPNRDDWFVEVVGTTSETMAELATWDIEWVDDPGHELEAALFGPWDWAFDEVAHDLAAGEQRYGAMVRRALASPASARRPFSIRTHRAAAAAQEALAMLGPGDGALSLGAIDGGWQPRVLASEQQFVRAHGDVVSAGSGAEDVRAEARSFLPVRSRMMRPWRTLPSLQAALQTRPARLWLVPRAVPVAVVPLASRPWASVLP